MAQDIGLDITSGPAVNSFMVSSLADGSVSGLSDVMDLGSPTPLEIGFDLNLDCLTNASGYAYLVGAWSNDNSRYSDSSNYETLSAVKCSAGAISMKSGTFDARAQYLKLAIQNEAGGVIAPQSTSLIIRDVFGDQV